MQVSTLLADPEAVSLESFVSQEGLIILRVHAVQKKAQCPSCQNYSSSLHSRYIRRVADLPWHGVAVRLELHSRKFRCRNEVCRRKVFCQRLPKVVQYYGRKTVRLTSVLTLLAFAQEPWRISWTSATQTSFFMARTDSRTALLITRYSDNETAVSGGRYNE